jgi:hypothetical protein
MGSIGVERKRRNTWHTGHWEDQFALERASLESESSKRLAESTGLVLFIAGVSFLLIGLFCTQMCDITTGLYLLSIIKMLTNSTVSNKSK